MGLSFDLSPMGHAALAARCWRSKGQTHLTVIVKGTFVLRHDAVMTMTAPLPICTEDRHFRDSPVSSLTRASDLAFYVPKPELVVVGSAFAARGQPAKKTTVRLALQTERTTLLDKRLEVVGDRRAAPGAAPPEPIPFDRMSLRYELAFGGMTNRENPVGRGAAPDDDGRVSYPNVFLPEGKGVAPAGFGPIASVWPARSALRGSLALAAANAALDLEVPTDFNDLYFQTAPLDQRFNEISGSELVTLVNMHPELPTLRSFLPRVRGVALLQTARGERLPVTLRIDTVHIEPDAMRAEIVYRGSITLAPDQLGHLAVAGALETEEQTFAFPDLTPAAKTARVAPLPQPTSNASTLLLDAPAPPNQGGGTLVLEPEPHAASSRTAPRGFAPFSKAALLQAAADKRPVPPAPPPPAAPVTHGTSGTMLLEPTLPAKPLSPTASVLPGGGSPKGTMLIEPFLPSKDPLPFSKGKRKRSGEVPAVIVGKAATPWSEQGKLAPVTPASGGRFSSTVFDESTTEPSAAPASPGGAPADSYPQMAPIAPPPAHPEPATLAAPPRDSSKGLWREESPAPAPAPAAPSKPLAPPRTNVKGALYKSKR